MLLRFLLSLLAIALGPLLLAAADPFRVFPYVQHPAPDAMTIRWFSSAEDPGTLTVQTPDGSLVFHSTPVLARELGGNPFAPEPGGPLPAPPYRHRVRVAGLRPGTRYAYTVRQGDREYRAAFRTAPKADQPIRFIVYADSETEPESSTMDPVEWTPSKGSNRPAGVERYVVNQTVGYRENLRVIGSRQPDFVAVAGDLVESGGKQRDWDEFWKHNAGSYGTLASTVPLLPALGNHENFGGPGGLGGYSARAADYAVEKYRTYFEVPGNGATHTPHEGRYYRLDYGPITLVTVDSSDGLPAGGASDTNHNLTDSSAPNFNPGSEQYRWLERQLADAQKRSRFTFVQFHHTAYGSGPHSIPFGQANFSGQSGIALRVLQPLLLRYGVDAVFSGHDEMWERSMVTGEEVLPDGTRRPQEIHFFDVGIGGDGLRGPTAGFDNPYRRFLAHDNAPEVWEGRRLLSGGKHYGHLEVNVYANHVGVWHADLIPVHVFPRMNPEGAVVDWERRTYEDVVSISQGSRPIRQDAGQLWGLGVLLTLAGLGLLLRRTPRRPTPSPADASAATEGHALS